MNAYDDIVTTNMINSLLKFMELNKIKKIELSEEGDELNITIQPKADVKYIDMNMITQEDKNKIFNNKLI